jgi:hypothetical protein
VNRVTAGRSLISDETLRSCQAIWTDYDEDGNGCDREHLTSVLERMLQEGVIAMACESSVDGEHHFAVVAASHVSAEPEPEPAAHAHPSLKTPSALAAFLSEARLSQYLGPLVELGADMPVDVKDLDEADLDALGMKKLEKTRLQKALDQL